MTDYRYLELIKVRDVLLARFVDQKLADEFAAERTAKELSALADRQDYRNLLLSFAGVEHLPSELLGRLMSLNKRIRQRGGKLSVCQLCPGIREVFRWTMFDVLLDIRDTEADGAAALQ